MAWWQGRNGQPVRTSTVVAESGSTGQTPGYKADPNSISLTNSKPRVRATSGLSVSSNAGAASLGQLGPNSDGLTGGTANKANSRSLFDPSMFGEYEKYKNSEGAMFADAQPGSGAELKSGMKAAVYYKGWLTTGQMFDASRPDDKGQLQPFVFQLGANQVIPGWEQGITGMKVGGTRLIIVPPAVGYGAQGQGSIPGDSVLVFQVQLLEVQ